MPATTFMERSRASLEYARQTVGTVRKAVRHRAASLNVCSFHCWVVHGEEPTRFSRSFTASAQSLSARRIIDGSGSSSPENTQQVRFSADGQDRIATPTSKGLVVRNRDPLRDEEFHSLSSGGSGQDGKSLKRDSDPFYLSSNELWARNNSGSARDASDLRARERSEEMEEEEFPVRRNKKAKYAATDTRTRPQINSWAPEVSPSTHKFDAASHLAWLLTRGSRADISLDTQENTSFTPPPQQQPRRRRRVPGEAERRQGRVFDDGRDYTQPPSPSFSRPQQMNANISECIGPHSTGPQLKQQIAPGLVPARKALPKPPPAEHVERIPVKVVRPFSDIPVKDDCPATQDVSETRKGIPRKQNPASKKAIRISMFKPIVGGLAHEPSPLQQLPTNIISTSTITTPTTFPYLPPSQPSHPLRPQHHTRKTTSKTNTAAKANTPRRQINPSTNFILTDAEFPRQLSRDGPGSRFPAQLVNAPTPLWASRRRRTREVPDVVLTSPTETSRSIRPASLARSIPPSPVTPPPANHLAAYPSKIGTRRSQPDDTRVYIPYSPAKRKDDCCSEDVEPKSGKVGDKVGKGVAEGGRRFVAYRPPPATAPPPATLPSVSSATTASKHNTNTPNDDNGKVGDDDIIKQAVAMNLIHFQPTSPPPPTSPPTYTPPSSTKAKVGTTRTTTTNPIINPSTNIHTRKETPSPPPSILSNSSSIRRLIATGLVDFTPPLPTVHNNSLPRHNIHHHNIHHRNDNHNHNHNGTSAGAGAKQNDTVFNKARDTKHTSTAKIEYKRLTLNTATWTSFASSF